MCSILYTFFLDHPVYSIHSIQQTANCNYYNSVIRSVLEYACPVWHTLITAGQSQDIERLRKRALRCILGEVSYTEALGLSSLSDRREQLTKHFFDQLKRPDSCLVHLMPLRRDISLTSYLQNAHLYELPKARTARYAKSFDEMNELSTSTVNELIGLRLQHVHSWMFAAHQPTSKSGSAGYPLVPDP